jgi:hypothetical protein
MSNAQKKNAKGKAPQQKNGKGKSNQKTQPMPNKKKTGAQIAAAYSNSRAQRGQPIRQSIHKNGELTLKWKEYVQDIAGSVQFQTLPYQIQPGNHNLFAWLSNQATFYQEYQFKSLKFHFETEKGTTANGKVMMAFMPDAADPNPMSKQEVLENMYKAAGATWEPFQFTIPRDAVKALGHWRFVRAGTLEPNLDIKTYDVGKLIIATMGMADDTLVGELYVEYEVVLRTPIQSALMLAGAYSKGFSCTTGVSRNVPFGTQRTVSWGNLDVNVSGSTVYFNRTGIFAVYLWCIGTGLHTSFVPVLTYGGIVETGFSNGSSDGGTQAWCKIIVQVRERGAEMIVDFDAEASTINHTDVDVYLSGQDNF